MLRRYIVTNLVLSLASTAVMMAAMPAALASLDDARGALMNYPQESALLSPIFIGTLQLR